MWWSWGRNPNVFWGGVLVVVGILFLLSNLNLNFNWDVIWPVLLIAFGLWLVVSRVGRGGAVGSFDASEARDGLDRGKLELSVGAGRVEVRSAALGDQLYRIHVDHGGSQPNVRLDRATGTVSVATRFDWFLGPPRLTIDAQLSDAVPWEVSCNSRSIHGEFDLSTTPISGFACRTGASELTLSLPAPKGDVPIRVQGGAMTVHIDRPAGAAIKVHASAGAIHMRADGSGKDGIGDRDWRSTGFDSAADRYDVSISGGAVNVDVKER